MTEEKMSKKQQDKVKMVMQDERTRQLVQRRRREWEQLMETRRERETQARMIELKRRRELKQEREREDALWRAREAGRDSAEEVRTVHAGELDEVVEYGRNYIVDFNPKDKKMLWEAKEQLEATIEYNRMVRDLREEGAWNSS